VPNGLTVLAALRPGEEEPLRQVLRAIGDDVKGKRAAGPTPRPHIDFTRSRTIHFARFAILDDPERGPDHRRLLFSSNYDGDLDGHLRELIEITSDMQAIWGRCEAYAGIADFPAFIRAHSHHPAAFYIAYRTATAAGIRRALEARRHLQSVRENADASALAFLLADPADDRPATRIVNRVADATRWTIGVVRRLDRALPLIADVVRAGVDIGLKDV
jgi:hypothetical protein